MVVALAQAWCHRACGRQAGSRCLLGVSIQPTTEDVLLIVWKIARRVHRLLDRRGLLEEGLCPDEQEHPFHRASVSGRTVLGESVLSGESTSYGSAVRV
jgi:hypothetical protein